MGDVRVVGPDGGYSWVPEKNLARAGKLGYRLASEREIREEALSEEYSGLGAMGQAAALGVGSAVIDLPSGVAGMMGFPQALPTSADVYESFGLDRESYDYLRTKQSMPFVAGEFVGSMLPGSPGALLSKGTSALGRGLAARLGGHGVASLGVPAALEGTVYGVAMQTRDDDIKNLDTTGEKVFASALGGALVGGVVGGAMGVGAKGLRKLGLGASKQMETVSAHMDAGPDAGFEDMAVGFLEKKFPGMDKSVLREKAARGHAWLSSTIGGKRRDVAHRFSMFREKATQFDENLVSKADSDYVGQRGVNKDGFFADADGKIRGPEAEGAIARDFPKRVEASTRQARSIVDKNIAAQRAMSTRYERNGYKLDTVNKLIEPSDSMGQAQFVNYYGQLNEIVAKHDDMFRSAGTEFNRADVKKAMAEVVSMHQTMMRDNLPGWRGKGTRAKYFSPKSLNPADVKEWLNLKATAIRPNSFADGKGAHGRSYITLDRMRAAYRSRVGKLNKKVSRGKGITVQQENYLTHQQQIYEDLTGTLTDDKIYGRKLANAQRAINGKLTTNIAARDNLITLGVLRRLQDTTPGAVNAEVVVVNVEGLRSALKGKTSDEAHVLIENLKEYLLSQTEVTKDLASLGGSTAPAAAIEASNLALLKELDHLAVDGYLHDMWKGMGEADPGIAAMLGYAVGSLSGSRTVSAASAAAAKFASDPRSLTNVVLDSPDMLAATGYVKNTAGMLSGKTTTAVKGLLGKVKPGERALSLTTFANKRAQLVSDEFPQKNFSDYFTGEAEAEQKRHDDRIEHLRELAMSGDKVDEAVSYSLAPMGQMGHELAGATAPVAQRAIRALLGATAPPTANTGVLDGYEHMSRSEIKHMDRMWEIVSKPTGFLDSLADGVASDADIKMFAKTYPNWFEEIKGGVFEGMAAMKAKGEEPPLKAKLQASAITGMRTTAMLDVRYLTEMKSFYTMQDAAEAQKGQAQQSKRKTSKPMELTEANWYETGSAKAERGES